MTRHRCLPLLLALIAAAPTPARADDDPPSEPVEASPRDRHWVRMLAEATVLFAGMEVKYWIDKDLNRYDFEYDADWRNVRERFVTLEAWSLDDNYFETNAWRHTAQGAANYLFARSNGFSSLQSYFATLTLSAAWELFGEYKEEVSINDLILTPRSGAVIGEAFWHLGTFLLRSEPNWLNQLGGNLLSGGRGVLDRIDGKPRHHPRRVGQLGFDATVTHRFETYVAAGTVEATDGAGPQGVFRAGLETELIMIPDFGRPGRASRLYADAVFSRMKVEATWNEHAMIDFEVFARTAVTAWHHKLRSDRGDGHDLLLGLSSAYEYGSHLAKDRDTRRTMDRIAIGHILGPTLDLSLRRGRFRARAIADVYGDFALVRNFAIDAHRALYPDDPVRSTILRDNYHHALGVTAAARLVLDAGGLEVGVAYQADRFESIESIDRYQEQLVDAAPLTDARDEGRLWGSYGLALQPGLTIELDVAVEVRDRAGTVGPTTRSEQERRYLGGMHFVF